MMEDFKKLPKMQHFKEGGSIQKEVSNFTKRDRKSVDIAQDKSMIKKAFKQHDKAEHDKEPTEIKLSKGGRAKKSSGSVRKFKIGGSVADEANKSSGDAVSMIKVKPTGDKKADAPNKATERPNFNGSDVAKEKNKPAGDAVDIIKVKPTGDKKADASSGAKGGPNKYKAGGKIQKYDEGGGVLSSIGQAAGDLGTRIKNRVMGTPAQNEAAKLSMAKYLKAKQLEQAAGKSMDPGEKLGMGLAGLSAGAPSAPAAPSGQPMPPVDTMGNATNMPAQKRGGKVKKAC